MNERRQALLHKSAFIALLALIALCVAWETALAPLRPGGSWLVLKIVPLLLPLHGVWKRDLYTMQWSSMLILLYFAEGIVRGMSDVGLSSVLGWMETSLTVTFFFCVVFFIRPYKQAAKALARKALQKAAE